MSLRNPDLNKPIETSNAKSKKEHSTAGQVITTVGTGLTLGFSNLGFGLLTRKAQLSHVKTSSTKKAAFSSGIKLPALACAVKSIGSAKSALLPAMKQGALKNSVVGQRDDITGLVVGEAALGKETQDKENLKEGSNSDLTLGQTIAAAAAVTVIDRIVMTSSNNKVYWKTNAILTKDFVPPNPVSSTQKFNAGTAGIMTGFAKAFPSIAGLVVQKNLKNHLPDTLSEQEKSLAVAAEVSVVITPPATVLDNLHAAQLASVNTQTCKCPSISQIIEKHGIRSIKPTALRMGVSLGTNAAQQYLVPAVTEIYENQITPKILKLSESAIKTATPTLERGIEERAENNEVDPFRNFGM